MRSDIIAAAVFGSLVCAVLLGLRLRKVSEPHLNADTRDTVKLALGLIATMVALLLGLLVSSAKNDYDGARSEVGQMVAKAVLLDRVLALYGPQAAAARVELHAVVEQWAHHLWPEEHRTAKETIPDSQVGELLYRAVQELSPTDDEQRGAKAQALSLMMQIGELRVLLLEQCTTTISTPLLVIVVDWLVVIFVGFGLLAPSNTTATVALLVSALAVSGAVFLILELSRPFSGVMQISPAPATAALKRLGK